MASHSSGGPATVTLSPERAIEVQCLLGADIQMVLDECTPYPATEDEALGHYRRVRDEIRSFVERLEETIDAGSAKGA